MRILAGDIGGTNTRLALFEAGSGPMRRLVDHSYSNHAHPSLGSIARDFLEQVGTPCDVACFGIAGPVTGRKVELTNLSWAVDGDALERELATRRVTLINDLEAIAWAVDGLVDDDLERISSCARSSPGNAAVIAPGTGLGQAGLYWDGERHRPFACEGGHTEFAPSSELEVELLRWLWQRHSRVSWERVASGPGLATLYRFLLEHRDAPRPSWLVSDREALPAEVTSAALDRGEPLAREALALFVQLVGREAGNLALKLMAFGGVFVGGGVPPKILPALRDGTFMDSFLAKGRMRTLMERMPVWVIRNDRVALLGAARCALDRAR